MRSEKSTSPLLFRNRWCVDVKYSETRLQWIIGYFGHLVLNDHWLQPGHNEHILLIWSCLLKTITLIVGFLTLKKAQLFCTWSFWTTLVNPCKYLFVLDITKWMLYSSNLFNLIKILISVIFRKAMWRHCFHRNQKKNQRMVLEEQLQLRRSKSNDSQNLIQRLHHCQGTAEAA